MNKDKIQQIKKIILFSSLILIVVGLRTGVEKLIQILSTGPYATYEPYGLLNVFYLFIIAGIFFILKDEKELVKKPNFSFLFVSFLSFILYIYTTHFVPLSLLKSSISALIIIQQIALFAYGFSAIIAFFPKKTFEKYSENLLTVFLIGILTIIVTTASYHDPFLVKASTYGSDKINSLFGNSTYDFNGNSYADYKVNDFSVIIGAECSGIESFVIIAALFSMIYLIDGNRIKNKKNYLKWCIVGIIIAFILNMVRVSLLMIVGQYNPQFAIDGFHTYSGMALFLLFVAPYIWLMYKYNMKK